MFVFVCVCVCVCEALRKYSGVLLIVLCSTFWLLDVWSPFCRTSRVGHGRAEEFEWRGKG